MIQYVTLVEVIVEQLLFEGIKFLFSMSKLKVGKQKMDSSEEEEEELYFAQSPAKKSRRGGYRKVVPKWELPDSERKELMRVAYKSFRNALLTESRQGMAGADEPPGDLSERSGEASIEPSVQRSVQPSVEPSEASSEPSEPSDGEQSPAAVPLAEESSQDKQSPPEDDRSLLAAEAHMGETTPPRAQQKRTVAFPSGTPSGIVKELEPEIIQKDKQWTYDNAPAIYKPAGWMRKHVGGSATARFRVCSRE